MSKGPEDPNARLFMRADWPNDCGYGKELNDSSVRLDDRKNSDSLVGSTVLLSSFRRAAFGVSKALAVETNKLRRGELG